MKIKIITEDKEGGTLWTIEKWFNENTLYTVDFFINENDKKEIFKNHLTKAIQLIVEKTN